jgi:pyridoxine 5-phosphate synthase
MRLYVNIDHVATVRQARRTDEPDPVRAAVLAELGGADGITVHLREDRRHVQDRDVRILMETARTGINLELAAASEVLALAEEWRPMQATLVPEKREEVTTEGGLALDTPDARRHVGAAADRLRAAGIRTSLFIDPDPEAVRASVQMALGRSLGLAVHAGHGLTYENVTPVAVVPEIEELNIGHSIISRAVLVGLERATREMAEILRRARA